MEEMLPTIIGSIISSIVVSFVGALFWLIKKSIDIHFDQKRLLKIQQLIDTGLIRFEVNSKAEATSNIEVTGNQVDLVKQNSSSTSSRVIPAVLFYSLMVIYSFDAFDYLLRVFDDEFSIYDIVYRAGSVGGIVLNLWGILETSLLIWFLICIYKYKVNDIASFDINKNGEEGSKT